MRKIPGNNYDFFLIHDEADPPCKRAQMEHLIRETLNSVQLAPKLRSCPSLVNDAVAFLAKGKSENMPNGSQGHYFAIHLACLKYKRDTSSVCNTDYYIYCHGSVGIRLNWTPNIYKRDPV